MLVSTNLLAQAKAKAPVKKAVPALEKILSGTALPYQVKNDSLAVIPYEGANIPSFNVIIQAIGDLYIVYVNLSEIFPDKLTESQYKFLLQRNDYFDITKIGLAEDGTFFLRADVYKATVNSVFIKRIISQVANVTNIIGGEIK